MITDLGKLRTIRLKDGVYHCAQVENKHERHKGRNFYRKLQKANDNVKIVNVTRSRQVSMIYTLLIMT